MTHLGCRITLDKENGSVSHCWYTWFFDKKKTFRAKQSLSGPNPHTLPHWLVMLQNQEPRQMKYTSCTLKILQAVEQFQRPITQKLEICPMLPEEMQKRKWRARNDLRGGLSMQCMRIKKLVSRSRTHSRELLGEKLAEQTHFLNFIFQTFPAEPQAEPYDMKTSTSNSFRRSPMRVVGKIKPCTFKEVN